MRASSRTSLGFNVKQKKFILEIASTMLDLLLSSKRHCNITNKTCLKRSVNFGKGTIYGISSSLKIKQYSLSCDPFSKHDLFPAKRFHAHMH